MVQFLLKEVKKDLVMKNIFDETYVNSITKLK